MAAWYQHWFNSAYYHQLYSHRNEQEAQPFVQSLLQHIHPAPGSRMLDVACGRGRHSRLLASAGFDVTGIDLSPENVSYAKQGERENLHFYTQDMRLPFWVQYFDYAFNFFTSFGYFETRREHNAAMRAICQSLKWGGLLVIDYLNVQYAETHLQPAEVKTIDRTTYEMQRWHDAEHFYKRIQVFDPELKQPLEFTEKVAKFSLADFTGMLDAQQMQVKEVFGNYQLQAYDVRQTPRMIILAKKNTNA